MVNNGCQDGGETHDLGALGQAKSEELIPAGPYQAGIAVLSGNIRIRLSVVHVADSKYVSCTGSKTQHHPPGSKGMTMVYYIFRVIPRKMTKSLSKSMKVLTKVP